MKKIILYEGGQEHIFEAKKLRTPLQEGGTCDWVPEDETDLVTKYVSKNGTYKASDDHAYGYSQVTVNVSGGSGSADSSGKPTGTIAPGGSGSAVVGTDPETGNEQVVGVDESGNLVNTPLPSSIVIVTNPTKMVYDEGDSIVLTGAVITAKNADGTTWTNADYPSGHVPIGEISVSPETATSSAGLSTDVSLSWSRPGDGKALTTTLAINVGPYLIDGNVPDSVNLSERLGDTRLHEGDIGEEYYQSACPAVLSFGSNYKSYLQNYVGNYQYMSVIRARVGLGSSGVYTYFIFSSSEIDVSYIQTGTSYYAVDDDAHRYPYYTITLNISGTYNYVTYHGGGATIDSLDSSGYINITGNITLSEIKWIMSNTGSSHFYESNASSGSGGGGTF